MTGREYGVLAGAGSAALLIGALGFQAAGYVPCELCILQRWPHVAAVAIAVLLWLTGRVRLFAVLGMAAAAVAAGLAFYHTGVEIGWWAGPAHCSGGVGDIAQLSPRAALERLQGTAVVRCDEVAWSFLGLSMAGWNAVFSAGLAVIWGLAATRAADGPRKA